MRILRGQNGIPLKFKGSGELVLNSTGAARLRILGRYSLDVLFLVSFSSELINCFRASERCKVRDT